MQMMSCGRGTPTDATSDTALREGIKDITECAMCLNTLNDPRSLPCLHTFCLTCLRNLFLSDSKEKETNCPLCRNAVTIPEGGFQSLPVNHFINKLIEMSQINSPQQKEMLCNVCLSIDTNETSVGYCVDCREHLCDGCFRRHRVQKSSLFHKTVLLNEDFATEELMKMSVNKCALHQDESTKFYCYNCRKTACVVCYVSDHKEHKCTDVSKAAVELTHQIEGDVLKLEQLKNQASAMLENVKRSENDMTCQGSNARKEILAKHYELMGILDFQYQQSMNELNKLEDRRKKELETVKEECEFELMAMNDLEKVWIETKTKGTPSDISDSGNGILVRAQELMSLHGKRVYGWENCSAPEYYKVTFKASGNYTENMLGKVTDEGKVSNGQQVGSNDKNTLKNCTLKASGNCYREQMYGKATVKNKVNIRRKNQFSSLNQFFLYK